MQRRNFVIALLHRRLLQATVLLTAVMAFLPRVNAKEFRFASQSEIRTMDPHGFYETFTLGMQNAVYEALVRLGPEMKVEPALATAWSQRDPVTWVFKIRPGVKFHDGTPMAPSDVVFSFHRAAAPGSLLRQTVSSIKEVVAENDTVVVTTLAPTAILPQKLIYVYVMSEKWAQAHDATAASDLQKGIENFASRHANGTGPFSLSERIPGQRTVFLVNPNWWDQPKHNLTRVVFTPIASESTRVAALVSNQVDMVEPLPVQDVARLKATPGLKIMQGPELRTIYLAFDVAHDQLPDAEVKGNPFKDVRVRQAVYQAIDESAIVKVVMQGAATPTALLNAPGITGFNESMNKRLPYDLTKAKALLSEAGYANGFSATLDCPNDRYVNDEKICLAVASMLAKVGIKINVNAQTRAKWFEKTNGQNTSFYMNGWNSATLDSHDVLFGLMATREKSRGGFNHGGYANPKIDALIDRIDVEVNTAKRNVLIDAAFKIIQEDIPVVPLHQQWLAWGMRDNVTVPLTPDNVVRFAWTQVK
jgi:peptide/nickel transport system substrate-binding protein